MKIFYLLFLLFFMFMLAGCVHSDKMTIISPDKKYNLITSINQDKRDRTKYLCVKFEIVEISSGKCVFHEQTDSSDNMRWEMAWDGNSRVWLKSSDTGTYYWEKQNNNAWMKFLYNKNTSPAPPGYLNEF